MLIASSLELEIILLAAYFLTSKTIIISPIILPATIPMIAPILILGSSGYKGKI